MTYMGYQMLTWYILMKSVVNREVGLLKNYMKSGVNREVGFLKNYVHGREVPWSSTKMGVSLYNFKDEAWIWLAIICSQVFLCTNMKYAQMGESG